MFYSNINQDENFTKQYEQECEANPNPKTVMSDFQQSPPHIPGSLCFNKVTWIKGEPVIETVYY